ncbi:hypothetical protein D9M68_915370 [compost metagenome]
MVVVALMVVTDKIIELVLLTLFRCDTPEQESTEGVALHKAVEQPTDLLWPPYELSLNRRQDVLLGRDLIQ